MMVIMAAILLLRLLPRLAKHVPSQAAAGFLFILGAVVVFPGNIATGIAGDPVVAGITTIITACSDSFLGMVSGIATRFLIGLF